MLDLCTGSGALAVTAALRGARAVTAVDVSRRAVLTARLNARLNGVRVRALRGDLFAPVRRRALRRHRLQPALRAADDDELPTRGARAAPGTPAATAACCSTGSAAEAPEHLRPGGVLLLVHSSLIGEEATLDRLRAGG